MRIHFIIESNRNTDREIIHLDGHRTNGNLMIVNTRLTRIGKKSIYDVTIIGTDENNIIDEMDGQISDGLFEYNTVEILEIIKESEK